MRVIKGIVTMQHKFNIIAIIGHINLFISPVKVPHLK